MKVLVIEDDEDTAAFVAQALREHGHVVDQAATGQDGLFLATGAATTCWWWTGCSPVREGPASTGWAWFGPCAKPA